MDFILYQLFWFLFIFLIMFGILYFLLSKKVKKGKKQSVGEFSYLIHRFCLNEKKLNFKSLSFFVSLINAFIISFVSTFIMLLPLGMIWRLMIGFVFLFALIYALYEIYGRYLKKRYGKER